MEILGLLVIMVLSGAITFLVTNGILKATRGSTNNFGISFLDNEIVNDELEEEKIELKSKKKINRLKNNQ